MRKSLIALHNYKNLLDILVKDEDRYARSNVAMHGYKDHLDILVKDESWEVRYSVAVHGDKEHFELLKNDDNIHVRDEANRQLKLIKDVEELNIIKMLDAKKKRVL